MSEDQEEFDNYNDDVVFALNEAAIYFDEEENLVVAFGDGKAATLELGNDNERAVIKTVMGDANTWAAFLGSLSAALKQHA